jgi:glycosyltransferase involved in cell wall biosynthesis
MKIVLPAHQVAGGIGTVVRGLVANLPAALPAGVELDALVGNRGVSQLLPDRLARIWLEQVQVALRGRDNLLHLPDHRAVILSSSPFSLTIHDVFFLDHPDWLPRAVTLYKTRMLDIAVRKRPRRVICVSDYARQRLLAHHPSLENRAIVIHSGVDPAPEPFPSRETESARTYFMTLSTIEPRKNHLTLLRAFENARGAGLELRWKVVGGAGYASRDILNRLSRAPGVDVVGEVDSDSVERLMAGASFVAVPSLAEGFGYPPLEAMARGIPVCCSSGTGLDETVGDAALRIEPMDVSGWTSALLSLASDASLRERLVASGFRQVQKFSWSSAATSYAKELLGGA